MRLLAPAKINLHLRVGPRRDDGFHPLVSWMTTVGLFDSLVLEVEAMAPAGREGSPAGQGNRPDVGRAGSDADNSAKARAEASAAPVALACDLPGLPCDERNLVVKIARAWMEAAGSENDAPEYGAGPGAPASSGACGAAAPRHVGGIRATLQKRIPVGAGLGGGSSDAARTLLSLNRLLKTGRAADDLSAFAARFGSDLPFFFFGPSSVCRGRGEIVKPVPRPAARWAVLGLPRVSMPTADVYRRFDEMGLGRMQDLAVEPDWYEWAGLKSQELLPRLVNDLEAPAFAIAPRLDGMRRRIEQMLGRPVRMSGSGSSLFTLFDAEPEARAASSRIERDLIERAVSVEVAPIFRDDLNEDFEDR